MLGEAAHTGPHAVLLSSWARPIVVPTALAYCGSMGEQPEITVAYRAARDAFIAAGSDPDIAFIEVPQIIGAAARDHSDWFLRPANERIAREKQGKVRER